LNDQVIELALTRKPSKKKGKAKTSHGDEKKFVEIDKPIAH